MNQLARGITEIDQPRIERICFTALAGILFGLFVLLIFRLPLKFTYYLIGGPLILFFAILTGRFKRFFQGVLIFILPIHSATHFFRRPYEYGAGGLSFGDLDIILIVLYLIWIYELLVKRSGSFHFFPKITVPALSLVGICAMSMIPAQDLYLALFETIHIFKAVLLYLYVANHFRSKRDIYFVLILLFVGLFLQSLLAFTQKVSGASLGLYLFGEKQELRSTFLTHQYYAPVARPGATLGGPGALAKYLVSLIPVSMTLLFTKIKPKLKLASGLVFTLALIALVLTMARSSWAGFVGSMAVVFLLMYRAKLVRMRTFMNIVVVVVILAGVGLSFFALVESRIRSEPPSGPIEDRMLQNERAIKIIKAYPLLGVGAKNYVKVQHLFSQLSHAPLIQLHNTYLIVAAEMGIPGLLILLWLLSSIFLQGLRNLKTKDIFFACLNIGLLGGLIARWIAWLPTISWVGGETTFWVLAGLVMANKRMYGQELPVRTATERTHLLKSDKAD
jgi:putative inorganic carbon (HCO3(-)) transporter